MSDSAASSPFNGHAVREPDSPVANGSGAHHMSESDLSDVEPTYRNAASRSASETPAHNNRVDSDDDEQPVVDDFEDDASEPSDNDVSDDGDFNDAHSDADGDADPDPDAIVDEDDEDDDASSGGSSRATKRKAGNALEDDYMRSNPELYGLRRSSRPVQRRAVVSDDDSDDEPVRRKPAKKRRLIAESSRQSSKRGTPARQPSPQDSDSDNYGGARARTFQKKARRKQEAQPDSVYTEKRWSSRRAAQVVTAGQYNESEVDDEEDYIIPPDQWAAEVEDTSPYIEKIVRHRGKEGVNLNYNSTRHDYEYFIKWQDKSHMHDTWETTESVAGFRGFRRLENYFRKVIDVELAMRYGNEHSPEQLEQWLIDREREEEAHEDYTKVERVVAKRQGDEGIEYYIKWKGLQYDECTWELAANVVEHAKDKIDHFADRASRSWVSDRAESNLNTRSRMTKLDKQPNYIVNGELREFQLKGLNFLALNWTRGNNVILADEMGLGKTVQSVSFLSWLRNDREQEGPFLVVAPLSVIPAWCDTFNHWSPDLNYVVYLGPESARRVIRENELLVDNNPKKPKFNVLVTSYDFILQDWEFLRSIKWQALMVDEAHRLKNRESQLYARLVSFNIPCRVLITGTPIQNNLHELSALLDFLNPGKVTVDDELVQLGSDKTVEAADDNEEKRVQTQKKLTDFHSAIAPYILRRTKEIVVSDLPPKTEKIIRVELSDVQLDYYKNILTRNYAALSDASGGHKQSLLNVMMELKKVSNHPYMFQGVEERVLKGSVRREDQLKGIITSSGKMMLLDQLLAKMKKDNHRVLIFSQMVRMLDLLSDYLRLRGYQYQRLDGTIPAGPRRMAINHFNAEGSDDFCFLLSTRAGGLGINLMTADTVIIYDSDWNPQADLQAMARAHRIGQKRPVSVYRLVAKQTIEEEVVKRARNKLFLEYLTIQAGVTDDKELQERFKDKGIEVDEAKTAEDIQHILKMRSQNLFAQSGNQEKLEQLDIDSILENAEITKTETDDKLNLSSGGIDWDNWMQYTDVKVDDLALDWDQIIPADDLAAIKSEEEKRKHEEYLAKAMEENAPRRATLKKRINIINNGGGDDDEGDDRAERIAKKRQRQKQEQIEYEERQAALRDPLRPLNEKETRNLIRALFRYGSMEERGEEIVADARLGDRDRDFLTSVANDLLTLSREAIEANAARVRDEQEKAGKSLARKDKKAVLVDFGEVKKINAETVVERPPQLRLLHKVIEEHGSVHSFRLHDATKAAHYTCEWGAREDGMLLVGIDRYGFGAWAQIRDDAELDMADKFFLEEHRVEKKEERKKGEERTIQSPGAVHLVRRSEYLLSVLLAKFSDDAAAQKAVENHHRSKKNPNGRRGDVSRSPAPALTKRIVLHKDRQRERPISNSDYLNLRPQKDGGGGERLLTPRGDFKRKHDYDRDERDERDRKQRRMTDGGSAPGGAATSKEKEKRKKLDPETLERLKRDQSKAVQRFEELMKLDDAKLDYKDNEQVMWSLLKPVRQNFKKIMETTPERVEKKKERAAIMGSELREIGNCVIGLKKNQAFPPEALEALMPRFWDFLSSIWPINDFAVSGKQLSKMYEALRAKDEKGSKDSRDSKERRDDLEDGEIDSDRDTRRDQRHHDHRERDRDHRDSRDRDRERDRDHRDSRDRDHRDHRDHRDNRDRERNRERDRDNRRSAVLSDVRRDDRGGYASDLRPNHSQGSPENGDRLSFRKDRRDYQAPREWDRLRPTPWQQQQQQYTSSTPPSNRPHPY